MDKIKFHRECWQAQLDFFKDQVLKNTVKGSYYSISHKLSELEDFIATTRYYQTQALEAYREAKFQLFKLDVSMCEDLYEVHKRVWVEALILAVKRIKDYTSIHEPKAGEEMDVYVQRIAADQAKALAQYKEVLTQLKSLEEQA